MTISVGPAGITMDDRMMNLGKGWFVIYKDGSVVTENDTDWKDVNRGEIDILGLKWHDKFWTVRDRTAYIQFKRGSVGFSPAGGVTSDIVCEERCIGYYEGSSKVIYRVNERTGRMRPEVQDLPNGTDKNSR